MRGKGEGRGKASGRCHAHSVGEEGGRLVSDDILGATPRQRAVYRDLSFVNTDGIAPIARAG